MVLLGERISPEIAELNLALHAMRCAILNIFSRLAPTLLPALLAKSREYIEELKGSKYISRLLSMTLAEFRDLLRKSGLIGDLRVERKGNIVKVEVLGCVIARDLHKYFIREHLCPIIEITYLILAQRFKDIKFAETPHVTETGAVAVFEVVE